MKIINLNNKGQLRAKDVAYFGGKYSFFERIKIKGIGSPKVIYKNGIEHFDDVTQLDSELSFANFELMKDGLLVRLRRNLQLRYVGFQLHEILKITLNPIGQELELMINTIDDQLLFEVPLQSIPNLKSFFEKNIFKGRVEGF